METTNNYDILCFIPNITYLKKKNSHRAGKKAQPLRAGTALEEKLSSVPSVHAKWLTITCNSCFRESDILLWPPWASALMHT